MRPLTGDACYGYGVVWREGNSRSRAASSSSSRATVRLEGMTGSEPTTREIAYDYLSEIRIGRSAEERIDGRPSLVLAPRTGDTLSIASVAQAGVVAEIAERLAALQLGAEAGAGSRSCCRSHEDAHEAVRKLLAAGPPFDPERARARPPPGFSHRLGSRIHLRVRARSGGAGAAAPEPELWQSAAAWHDYLAGPPRIAEDVFSWERPDQSTARCYRRAPERR